MVGALTTIRPEWAVHRRALSAFCRLPVGAPEAEIADATCSVSSHPFDVFAPAIRIEFAVFLLARAHKRRMEAADTVIAPVFDSKTPVELDYPGIAFEGVAMAWVIDLIFHIIVPFFI
jgi:hypothetical protein